MSSLYHSHTTLFADIGAKGNLEHARSVIIPAPLEYTVCYGEGTSKGPEAILTASAQMEMYDEELETVPADLGIGTIAPLNFNGLSHTQALDHIHDAVVEVLSHKQIPIVLGGEHSLTPPCIRAVQEAADFAPLGIVQFDAHGDLRNEYEDTPISHACAMRRSLDVPGVSLLEVGIRSISAEEIHELQSGKIQATILYAHDLHSGRADFIQALKHLPERVYITVDLDCLDPSIMPSTGTPEPGGLDWYSLLSMIRAIAATKHVVGCDVVELAPIDVLPGPDFLAAKLTYRMIGAITATLNEVIT